MHLLLILALAGCDVDVGSGDSGGQSGSEATSTGECEEIERDDYGDPNGPPDGSAIHAMRGERRGELVIEGSGTTLGLTMTFTQNALWLIQREDENGNACEEAHVTEVEIEVAAEGSLTATFSGEVVIEADVGASLDLETDAADVGGFDTPTGVETLYLSGNITGVNDVGTFMWDSGEVLGEWTLEPIGE